MRERKKKSQDVVAHTFNPSTTQEMEAETGRSLGSRPAWTIQTVTSQTGIHTGNMSLKQVLDLGITQWKARLVCTKPQREKKKLFHAHIWAQALL